MSGVFLLTLAAATAVMQNEEPTGPECDDPATIATCLGEWGESNIESLGMVLTTLTERTLRDQRFAENCHQAWHIVGEAAGRKYPIDTALEDWAYGCAGGFMHGAVSTAVLRGSLEEFTADIVRVCDSYKNRPEVVYLDCWHGAGHGYAQVLEYPESLYACKPVATGQVEFDWCAWGATEELVEPFQSDQAFRERYEPQLETLCTDISIGHAACFRALAPMMYIAGWEFERIYGYCDALGPEHQELCSFSAGHVLGMNWVAGVKDPAKCDLHPSLAEKCAAGAGRYVGRLAEWGMLEAELVDKSGTAGVCPAFRDGLRQVCQEESEKVRALELSPQEERELTKAW